MIKLLVILLLVSFHGGTQNLEGTQWKSDRIIGFGLKSVKEIQLTKFDTLNYREQYGNVLEFNKHNKFHNSYSAFCGNDCFASSTGKYKQIDSNHIELIVERIYQYGDCVNFDSIINYTLGVYYIYKVSKNEINLIKSDGNLKQDLLNVEYNEMIIKSISEQEWRLQNTSQVNTGEEFNKLFNFLKSINSIDNFNVLYTKEIHNSFYIYLIQNNKTKNIQLVLNKRHLYSPINNVYNDQYEIRELIK